MTFTPPSDLGAILDDRSDTFESFCDSSGNSNDSAMDFSYDNEEMTPKKKNCSGPSDLYLCLPKTKPTVACLSREFTGPYLSKKMHDFFALIEKEICTHGTDKFETKNYGFKLWDSFFGGKKALICYQMCAYSDMKGHLGFSNNPKIQVVYGSYEIVDGDKLRAEATICIFFVYHRDLI